MNRLQIKSLIEKAKARANEAYGEQDTIEKNWLTHTLVLGVLFREYFPNLDDAGYFSTDELEEIEALFPTPPPAQYESEAHLAAAFTKKKEEKASMKTEEFMKHPLVLLIKKELNLPAVVQRNVVDMATAPLTSPYKDGIRTKYPSLLAMYDNGDEFKAFCAERIGQMKMITEQRGYMFDWTRAVKHLADIFRPERREDGAAQWPGYLVWYSKQAIVNTPEVPSNTVLVVLEE
jgi:hypothetical protein